MLIKRLRSALRMGSCEIKEVNVYNDFNHYITMDIKLWIPAKDLKQTEKLLVELAAEMNNGKRK